MKKYLGWSFLILVVIIGITLSIYYISFKMDTKVPEIEKSIEEIVKGNEGDLDIEINKSDITQAHNYAWARLNGTIGRARELRSKYK